MKKLAFVATTTIAVWLTVMPGAAGARAWLSSSAPTAWIQVNSPVATKSALAVRLQNHLNGILASKCQATYTRNLAGTDLRVWAKRHLAAHRAKNACANIRDWRSAVMYVQRWFPGTAQWLLDCSSSEGGHGAFVYFGHLSYPVHGPTHTPGGWMQYMSGTFYTDYNAAVAYLRTRGIRVPASTASWFSPFGQAIAAGWARYTGHTPRGKWTGANC